jgi:Flp pilus assembly protein TadD
VYERDTRHDAEAAGRAFETSLRLRPDYYSPMYNLAVLERSQGRVREAREWLFRSLTAVGGDPAPALVSWAHEEERGGRSAEARAVLERGTRAFPASEPIAREYALALFRAHDCSRALAVLAPFEAASREPRTFNALALVQTCLKNRPEVVRLLERSLAVKPDQPEVARSLSVARGSADR